MFTHLICTRTACLLLAMILLLVACQEDDEATQSTIDAPPGHMKITIDGKTMTSMPDAPANATLRETWSLIYGYFEVADGEYVNLKIFIQDIKEGSFTMDGNSSPNSNTYAEYAPNNSLGLFASYNSTKAQSGEITITELDLEKKIISGVFEVELVRINRPKISRITKGHFNQIVIN